MNEKLIEKKLVAEIAKRGGRALKFVSPGLTGVPDRIVLLPGGRVLFVELKTTGKKPTPRQVAQMQRLKGMDFIAVVVDTQEKLARLLNLVDGWERTA